MVGIEMEWTMVSYAISYQLQNEFICFLKKNLIIRNNKIMHSSPVIQPPVDFSSKFDL